MLLILASISLSVVFSEKGIFKRAEGASNKYNEAKAREVLETVLLSDAQYEKHINPEYNQDKYLDNLIKNEIPGSDVKGDLAIIGEYAYELYRSVPKIGRYLGLVDDLALPRLTVTEAEFSDNYRTATFTATAIEEKNGITKIEIWLEGKAIEILTKNYNCEKTAITLPIKVNRDGIYTVKVYEKINDKEIVMASVEVAVTGIVPAVEFTPNGNETWAKQHTTQITVRETGERVTSIKYKWTTDRANEPKIGEFIEECPEDNKITGKGEENKAEIYYLWILLTTESGKTNICGSQGFNFDNEGPEITEFATEKYSIDGITIKVTARDNESKVAKIEFFVDEILKGIEDCKEKEIITTKSKTVERLTTGEHACKIITWDLLGNYTEKTINGTTKQYLWEKWSYENMAVKSIDYGEERMIEASLSIADTEEMGYWTNISISGGKIKVSGWTQKSVFLYRSHYEGQFIWGSFAHPPENMTDGAATSIGPVYKVIRVSTKAQGGKVTWVVQEAKIKVDYWPQPVAKVGSTTSNTADAYKNGEVRSR